MTGQKINTPASAVLKRSKRRRKASSLDRKKARAGWIFVLPFVIGFVVIYLPIIYNSILYSFTQIRPAVGGGFQLSWVGWENYYEALNDTTYLQTLSEGIQQLVFDIPAIVIFSLFMAILLNQKMIGRAAFRAIFFVPVILSTGILTTIDMNNAMLDSMSSGSIDMGDGSGSIVSAMDIQNLLSSVTVGEDVIQYVTNLVNNIYDIVNRSGVQMLIFLAGLQSISPAIYESCQIDGATSWETFWKITLPMISPMILVNTVYTVIDSFTASDNNVMVYIDEVYATAGGDVLSSAMAWIYFLIVFAIIALVAAICSFFVFYQRRDS
ncbi:MAG: sugar ABC transporter permease [Eubacteriales bacterium]|nr:sugar ABC transporter permease [Eubacteriales bacterium]